MSVNVEPVFPHCVIYFILRIARKLMLNSQRNAQKMSQTSLQTERNHHRANLNKSPLTLGALVGTL